MNAPRPLTDEALDDLLAQLPRFEPSEAALGQVLRGAGQGPAVATVDPAFGTPPPQDIVSAPLGAQEHTGDGGAVSAGEVVPGAGDADPSRWQWRIWGAMAAAALVVLGLAGLRSPQPETGSRFTVRGAVGPERMTRLELDLSLLRDQVPLALPPGARARADDTLLFRYTTDREGYIYLVRSDGEQLEVFYGTPSLVGTHHLSHDGRISGYHLGGLSGRQRFAAIWSDEPWPAGNGGAVAAAPAGLREVIDLQPTDPDVAIAIREIEVR